MLNFRKLKHEVAPAVLKEGKGLFDKGMVESVKVLHLNTRSVRFSCRVLGNFDHCYESELEIDMQESVASDSDCDCTYKYDCQHLAAVVFYLEEHFDELVLEFSKENDLEKTANVNEVEKKQLKEALKEVETKESARKGKKYQKELLEEYMGASELLGQSPFFHTEEDLVQDKAELAVIINPPAQKPANQPQHFEIQLSLRLPFRSKPLIVQDIKAFLNAVRYNEAIYIAGKKYFFPLTAFDQDSAEILKHIIDFARVPEIKGDRQLRLAQIDIEDFGTLLASAYRHTSIRLPSHGSHSDDGEDSYSFPCLYYGNLEEPLKLAKAPAKIRFELEYLEAPAPKLLMNPTIALEDKSIVPIDDACLFECAKPGMLYQQTYYCFQPCIKRAHLRHLTAFHSLTIPEPLFGTFVENALPELMRFAEVSNRDIIERFVTLPFVEHVKAECDINYLNGELEATLYFLYGSTRIPASSSQLTVDHISTFITRQGVLARNLTEEQKIIASLFQDFVYDPAEGVYVAKTDKKIVEFMTEIIPNHQQRVKFNCPENLLEQFVYDDSQFILKLRETDRIDEYEVDLTVEGHMNGVTVDLLWDCLSSRRAYIELARKQPAKKKSAADKASTSKSINKVLVLDLEKLAPVVQVFDEIGINKLENHVERRPLWSLVNIEEDHFKGLPIKFSMTKRLKEVQQQMLGITPYESKEIPSAIKAVLRSYQHEGVQWLDRLRSMHLNGILADDMGLGKTLQAIIAITQSKIDNPDSISIIVCPTSLVYNWKEEFAKFNPKLRILVVDGNPIYRKKLLNDLKKYDIIITSYTLLQKDIEFYKTIHFCYAILDEAQHIKNRSTRNAQSVKMIHASHRLILTGTPIENSLEELWSLFDFLMPGLLSSYDRFVEKYIRQPVQQGGKHLEPLRKKVSPFILRRMKKDVLQDLPPVSEIVYHCHLSDVQQELYRSYATTAREELSQLVNKEGFDRVQIHVLATLTRLKQICCHPAIFAKDKAEIGDSAKYEMLMELLQTLMDGKHKTVIFSQYTRMLNIMREDFQKRGIKFEYLDGSSKNRLSIVKKFNEDENTPVFLVSLKAGGSGLNLVGADTVIHYDMWWNPAVENQATDRVHRLGQKNSVSSYKLITLNTIEEKIQELHKRKKTLVKEVVSHDDDVLGKLTWEEVLELLQT